MQQPAELACHPILQTAPSARKVLVTSRAGGAAFAQSSGSGKQRHFQKTPPRSTPGLEVDTIMAIKSTTRPLQARQTCPAIDAAQDASNVNRKHSHGDALGNSGFNSELPTHVHIGHGATVGVKVLHCQRFCFSRCIGLFTPRTVWFYYTKHYLNIMHIGSKHPKMSWHTFENKITVSRLSCSYNQSDYRETPVAIM